MPKSQDRCLITPTPTPPITDQLPHPPISCKGRIRRHSMAINHTRNRQAVPNITSSRMLMGYHPNTCNQRTKRKGVTALASHLDKSSILMTQCWMPIHSDLAPV